MKAILAKKTKFSGVIALFLMVLVGACKDKGSENLAYHDLALSQIEIDVMPGESHIVNITAGSGSYAVSVDYEAVAAASLDGNRITITGKSSGTATIHVKDTETQQKAQVTITVEGVPDDGEVYPQSKKLWVSPDGNGTGWRRNTPGSLAAIIGDVQRGDTVVLLEGTYTNMKIEDLKGTAEQNITIRSENIGKAFFDGQVKINHVIEIRRCEYINFEGIKAGNALHSVWVTEFSNNLTYRRCSGFNAGYEVLSDGNVLNTYTDNCHVFAFNESEYILAEDVWGWGTGRYLFLYYECKNSVLRRGVFRPTAPELGFGSDRGPHSGFNLYNCDNSIAENCIAFETRFHPESNQAPDNPWGLVMGGMVFDDHYDRGYNYVFGCFDLDNGNWRDDIPRANPAVHVMSKWNGKLEDIVIWQNAHNYRIQVTSSGKVDLPERALIGGPTAIHQNTIDAEKLKYQYVDGVLTTTPLWPWPYEDNIKEQMEMEVTMTEYVHEMVAPHLDLK